MASPTINTMTSFSGADLVVTFANQVVGELQQISWAVQREKAPIFTLGSSDARSFSRGKRGIAGSMVFAVFDHDALVAAIQHVWDKVAPPAMFTAAANNAISKNEAFLDAVDMLKWNMSTANSYSGLGEGYGFSGTSEVLAQKMPGSDGAPASFDKETGYYVQTWSTAADVYVPAGFEPIRGENVIYADTLPPFDITLTFANEYGQTAFQKIYDVDILNEASGVSVDSIIMERQVTYIARRLSPLIQGVYSREKGGAIKGISPTAAR